MIMSRLFKLLVLQIKSEAPRCTMRLSSTWLKYCGKNSIQLTMMLIIVLFNLISFSPGTRFNLCGAC